jgi:hypothetical protein
LKTLLLFAVGVYVQQFLICEDLLRWCYLDFFGAHLASQALIGQGASLPMIDLGARANSSGRDLDLIAALETKGGSAFLPIDIGDGDTRSSGASLPIDLGATAYNSGRLVFFCFLCVEGVYIQQGRKRTSEHHGHLLASVRDNDNVVDNLAVSRQCSGTI